MKSKPVKREDLKHIYQLRRIRLALILLCLKSRLLLEEKR